MNIVFRQEWSELKLFFSSVRFPNFHIQQKSDSKNKIANICWQFFNYFIYISITDVDHFIRIGDIGFYWIILHHRINWPHYVFANTASLLTLVPSHSAFLWGCLYLRSWCHFHLSLSCEVLLMLGCLTTRGEEGIV